MHIDTITETAKILSDATRVHILLALKKHKELCVSEIAEIVSASHSATSHQLAKLEAKKVVVCFRDGQKMCYELTDSKITRHLLQILTTIKA